MKKKIIMVAMIWLILMMICLCIHQRTHNQIALSAAITCGTCAYHFWMRLCVGSCFEVMMRHQADYTKPWYQTRPWEQRVYQKLHVKVWKHKLPTFNEDTFDVTKHTWEEIAQAMCQAELVHETIIVLSFIPVAFSWLFGAFPVFLVTSIFAACFDGLFVMLQRYNRPRVLKLIQRKCAKQHSDTM